MAALEAVSLSLFPASSPSSKFLSSHKQLASVKLNVAYSAPSISLNFPFSPHRLHNNPTRKPCFLLLCSTVQEAATTEEDTADQSQSEEPNSENKLAIFNLPFSVTAEDIKTLLSECGTVEDAELVTQRNGRSRGFGFVTMSTAEEAQAAIDKFDSHELSGRVIRVVKKVDRADTDDTAVEAYCQVYASNISWKVRSDDLKEFFSPQFRPLAVKIIFERRPAKRSAGYAFVTFATKEEAEAAISAMKGKPLMDRPIDLKISLPSRRKEQWEGEAEASISTVSETQPGGW